MNNRPLKFRIYSYTDKLFHYFDIYDYPSGIYGAVTEPQQYTGLNDCQGKEIFEGDIVEYTLGHKDFSWTDVVVWGHYGFRLVNYDGIETASIPLTYIPDMVIIGNVIESKELKKKIFGEDVKMTMPELIAENEKELRNE